MDVSQAVEESAVFNHTKKCFQRSGNFRRKTCIFCAVVVNKKGFLSRSKIAPLKPKKIVPGGSKIAPP